MTTENESSAAKRESDSWEARCKAAGKALATIADDGRECRASSVDVCDRSQAVLRELADAAKIGGDRRGDLRSKAVQAIARSIPNVAWGYVIPIVVMLAETVRRGDFILSGHLLNAFQEEAVR